MTSDLWPSANPNYSWVFKTASILAFPATFWRFFILNISLCKETYMIRIANAFWVEWCFLSLYIKVSVRYEYIIKLIAVGTLTKLMYYFSCYLRYSSIITSHTRGTPCMVPRMFLRVKFKNCHVCIIISMRRDVSLPETTHGICSKRVITQDVAIEVPTSWGSSRISVGV